MAEESTIIVICETELSRRLIYHRRMLEEGQSLLHLQLVHGRQCPPFPPAVNPTGLDGGLKE
jgi:hypothetical protein